MKKLFYILLPVVSLLMISCEELENLFGGEDGLSQEDVANGLKVALEVGTDSSTTFLSRTDGYYADPIAFIPLPEEAQQVRTLLTSNSTINSLFNLDNAFENVVKSVNRAAEESAKEAAPVFKDAITGMTFSDAWEILNGRNPLDARKDGGFDSTAATAYFKQVTKPQLVAIYAPKINNALDRNLGLGFSATDAWTFLTTNYNTTRSKGAVDLAIDLAGLNLPEELNDDLGEFSTGKALDGLFHKVGEEEKKIRKDPWQWTIDILRKVFGSVAEK